MLQVEQEVKGDTFTSTPRRRKKARTGRARENSVMVNSNITGNQSTLDESTMSNQQNHNTSVPVHTKQVVHTTVTTTTSLFSQRNLLQIGQTRGLQDRGGTSTQVVFSTCKTLHPGQHTAIRATSSDNTHVITTVPTSVAPTGQVATMATINSHQTVGALHGNVPPNTATGQNFIANPTEQLIRGQFNLPHTPRQGRWLSLHSRTPRFYPHCQPQGPCNTHNRGRNCNIPELGENCHCLSKCQKKTSSPACKHFVRWQSIKTWCSNDLQNYSS